MNNYFKNKKITVMGLGLLGRGVGDTEYLAESGAELIVTDLKSEEELKESVEQLKQYDNITFVLGEHRLEDFKDRDMILVAPSVPLNSQYVAEARKNGIECAQSAALFVNLTKIPIIGVTGTRGKSTVSQMIHHVLQVVTGEEIILGGTVRGVSNLQLLKKVKEDSIAVFELDSWQLQGFGWAKISPQIAVFTNFMEDHMNYYRKDGMSFEAAMDSYFNDKANIFLYQEESGVFITTPEVFNRAKKFAEGKHITLGQEVVLTDASALKEDCILSIPGEHNRFNAALAYEALKASSLSDESIFEGLSSFPGVPGRLEYLKEVNLPDGKAGGVKIYNDNNATTPNATLVGLKAVAEKKNIILIMGGADKGIDMSELVKEIPKYCKKVVMLSGTGTDTVKNNIDGVVVENLEVAVATALGSAERGDVILFSPAFASFGMFKNEYDRNDQFVNMIEKLK